MENLSYTLLRRTKDALGNHIGDKTVIIFRDLFSTPFSVATPETLVNKELYWHLKEKKGAS